MSVTLTQPVAGKDRGESYSGPMEEWLVAYGYAKKDDGKDKVNVTGVKADKDPTLKENREAPGEDLKLFGSNADLEAERPVETGERESEGVPATNVPGIGDEEDAELKATRERLDGSDVEVKEGQTPVEKAATKAAEKSAGTGDNLLDEPTTDVAPIEDAPTGKPTPARRKSGD